MKRSLSLKIFILYIVFISSSSLAFAFDKEKGNPLLDRKNIKAIKVTEAPKIDGFLDDAIWA